jgi:hypothetical protein
MKKIAIYVLLCSTLVSQAQIEDKVYRGSNKLKFGFNLGLNYSNIADHPNLLNDAKPINNFGFRLGGIADFTINKNLALSPKFETSFSGGKLALTNDNNDRIEYEITPVMVEIMLHSRYIFDQSKHKLYILFGPNFKVPLNDADNASVLGTSSDLALDFGLGYNNQISFLTIRPEIRYSYGLRNISNLSNTGIINNHNIALVINFL